MVAEGSPALTRRCTGCTKWRTPRSTRRAPSPTRPKSCFRIRSIRGRKPSSASRSPPAANCSSAPRAATASREWGLTTPRSTVRTPVDIRIVWEKPFCRLLYFDRKLTRPLRSPQPRVLIVAPMSGHYATLLRGTVEAFLPSHEVYITDWADARMVPLTEGRFDLDDYVDYLIEMLQALGGDMHVIAVCQPSVPVVAAVSLMEADNDPVRSAFDDPDGRPDRHPPQSDRGQQPRRRARHRLVPQQRHHQGAVSASGRHARRLSGLPAALGLHQHEPRPPHGRPQGAVQESGEGRRRLWSTSTATSTTNISRSWTCTAEFYLQTVDTVFVKHALPKGEMTHRGKPVDPSTITRVALMTVEGENDDISGLRPDRGDARTLQRRSRPSPCALRADRASATTASSMARASSRKSCRESPTS